MTSINSYVYNDNKIKGAIKNNLLQNYIYTNADNLFCQYLKGDLNPTNIFPEIGVINNIEKKNYNNEIFSNDKKDFNIKSNANTPLFMTEDAFLPDTINIGLQKSINARTIGTAQY